jgi:hypothetical protein
MWLLKVGMWLWLQYNIAYFCLSFRFLSFDRFHKYHLNMYYLNHFVFAFITICILCLPKEKSAKKDESDKLKKQ